MDRACTTRTNTASCRPSGAVFTWCTVWIASSTALKVSWTPWCRSKLGTGLTDDAARVIGSSLTSLRRLSISRCAELGVYLNSRQFAHEGFAHPADAY